MVKDAVGIPVADRYVFTINLVLAEMRKRRLVLDWCGQEEHVRLLDETQSLGAALAVLRGQADAAR